MRRVIDKTGIGAWSEEGSVIIYLTLPLEKRNRTNEMEDWNKNERPRAGLTVRERGTADNGETEDRQA